MINQADPAQVSKPFPDIHEEAAQLGAATVRPRRAIEGRERLADPLRFGMPRAQPTRPVAGIPPLEHPPHHFDVLLRHRPRSIRPWRLLGLVLLAGGGQCLVSRPVLNAPLELLHRRRCCPTGMPNDPYDLPNASALTAIYGRPAGGGQALGVSTAALADHVCDRWHRREIRLFPETADPSSCGYRRPAIARSHRRPPIFHRRMPSFGPASAMNYRLSLGHTHDRVGGTVLRGVVFAGRGNDEVNGGDRSYWSAGRIELTDAAKRAR